MLNKINKAVLGVVAAGSLALSAHAQNDVYAVEFNTGDNGFGIINLMNGSFTQISDLGSTLYNDIAYAPDGTLYGLANNGASLVTFDRTSGPSPRWPRWTCPALNPSLSIPNGTLFGASQSGLYTIDPTTGQSSYIGILATLTISISRRTSVLTPMAIWHLRILRLLDDPKRWFIENGRQPQFSGGSLSVVLIAAFPELDGRRYFNDLIVKDLYSTGLLGVETLYTMMSGSGMLAGRSTDIGKQFINFITHPKVTG